MPAAYLLSLTDQAWVCVHLNTAVHLLSFPYIWQNLDWSHPRSFKRRSILVSSACIHSQQPRVLGEVVFYPSNRLCPFYFHLFVYVCLRSCASHLLLNVNRLDAHVTLQEGYTALWVFVLSKLWLLIPRCHLSPTLRGMRLFSRPNYLWIFQNFSIPINQSCPASVIKLLLQGTGLIYLRCHVWTGTVSTCGEGCWKFAVPSEEMSQK